MTCTKGCPEQAFPELCSEISHSNAELIHFIHSINLPVWRNPLYFFCIEPFQWWYNDEQLLGLLEIVLYVCQNDHGILPVNSFPKYLCIIVMIDRSSLIVYGADDEFDMVGSHWISGISRSALAIMMGRASLISGTTGKAMGRLSKSAIEHMWK